MLATTAHTSPVAAQAIHEARPSVIGNAELLDVFDASVAGMRQSPFHVTVELFSSPRGHQPPLFLAGLAVAAGDDLLGLVVTRDSGATTRAVSPGRLAALRDSLAAWGVLTWDDPDPPTISHPSRQIVSVAVDEQIKVFVHDGLPFGVASWEQSCGRYNDSNDENWTERHECLVRLVGSIASGREND